MKLEKTAKLNLIEESEVPGRAKKRSEEWLQLFKKIPKGKALVLTQDEYGVKPITVAYMVSKFKRTGDLPASYKAIRRTVKGKNTIYVLNSIEGTEEQTEKHHSP